jgi:diacylglycerol kinase (ATP)
MHKIPERVSDMKKAILFYNPKSGNQGISARLDTILERFQQENIIIQPYRLTDYEDSRLLEALQQVKPDFAVISGGDGTLNYVVNVLQKNKMDMPLGLIPSGTCNDFASSLGIPSALQECLDVILKGKWIEVDLGLINDTQYFLNTCAGGYFVDVSFSTNKDLKKNFGPLAYYMTAISEVSQIKPFELTIHADGQKVQEQALLFIITNGTDAAGFKNIINEADYADGIMDIMIVRYCSHVELGALLLKVISREPLLDKNIVKLKAKSCSIECSHNISLSIDGEKGNGLPMDVRFINKKLKVFTVR